jgi:shikimate kinase
MSSWWGDTDHEIEARTGADIPWIFDVEGEEGFRKREEAVIEDLTLRSGVVIATGGGGERLCEPQTERSSKPEVPWFT